MQKIAITVTKRRGLGATRQSELTRFDETSQGKKCWVWGSGAEPKIRENGSTLLVHIATIVFGRITGKCDDMICIDSDQFSHGQKEVADDGRTS